MLKITDVLNLRTEFEEVTSDFRFPDEISGSNIYTLEWFVENGHRSNSLRSGYDRAKEIATIIVEDYNGAKETGAGI